MHYSTKLGVAAFLLLAYSSPATAQTQTRISFAGRTLTLSQAVAAISRDSGLTLSVDKALADEPLVLQLHQVPATEVMKRLALVMGGEWVRSRNGQTLARTPRVLSQMHREQTDKRIAAINAQLRELSASRKKSPHLDKEKATHLAEEFVEMFRQQRSRFPILEKRNELLRETAEARLFQDLLSAIGAAPLSAAASDRIHIFASSATGRQQPIPRIGPARLKQYADEHNDLAKALIKADESARRQGLLFTGLEKTIKVIEKPPTSMLLFVTPDFDGSDFEIVLYSADGMQVSAFDWRVGERERNEKLDGLSKFALGEDEESENEGEEHQEAERDREREAERDKEHPKLLDPDKPAIATSEVERIKIAPELAALSVRTEGRFDSTPFDSHIVDTMLHPDEFDPLQLGFEQGILGIAQSKNLNVIATMADEAFYVALRSCHNGSISPSAFLSDLTLWGGEEIEQKDGWLLAWPRDQERASMNRADRKALARFVQLSAEKGFTAIEDWNALASSTTGDPSKTALLYRSLLLPTKTRQDVDINALKLLNALSEDEIQILRSGKTLGYATLGKEPQTVLKQLAIESKRPDAFANGIPASAGLNLKDIIDEHFLVVDSIAATAIRSQPVSGEELARRLAMAQRPDLFARASAVGKVRIIPRRTVTFQLVVNGDVALEKQLTEVRPPSKQAVDVAVLKDHLSSNSWQRIDGRVQELLKYYREHEQEIRKSLPNGRSAPPTL